MATKKKTTIQYSTSGLNSKDAVQNALAAAQYRPSETVTQAADALEQWQSQPARGLPEPVPGADRRAAGQGAEPENLQLRPRGRPHLPPVRPELPPERPRRQHRRRGPGGRPDRGLWLQLRHQRRPAGLPAADERAEQHHPHPVQPGAGQLYQRRGSADGSAGRPEPAGTERAGSVPAAAGRLLHPAGAKAGRLRIRQAQDYARYNDYLSSLDTLYGYYSQEEQEQAARKQQGFNNVMSVLGLIGNIAQLAISGTTGLGSLLSGLAQTGYSMYADNRDYEAAQADAAWERQMQEQLRQDGLAQQAYESQSAERQYQDALASSGSTTTSRARSWPWPRRNGRSSGPRRSRRRPQPVCGRPAAAAEQRARAAAARAPARAAAPRAPSCPTQAATWITPTLHGHAGARVYHQRDQRDVRRDAAEPVRGSAAGGRDFRPRVRERGRFAAY